MLLLAGGSLVLLRGAYSANRGILDQPGDRLMARRLATCGSFQCSKNPMSLGATVLSPRGWPIPFVPILSPSIRCLPRFYFCFVTSWLYLWKSRSSEVVSGKPIASKISTTREGYRAADTADAWNRTVGFLAEDAQKLTGGLTNGGADGLRPPSIIYTMYK